MRILPSWSTTCAALAIFALAHFAAVTSRADTLSVDVGNIITSSQSDVYTIFDATFKVYFGCMTPGHAWGHTGTADGQFAIPVGNVATAQRVVSGNKFVSGLHIGGVSTNNYVAFNHSFTVRAAMVKNNVLADAHVVTISVTGKVKYVQGGTISRQPLVVAFTLKPGGPASGKERIDNGEIPANLPPDDPGQIIDVYSYIPDHNPGVGGNVGSPNFPANFNYGGKSGSFPVGGSWQQWTVPTGSIPPNGLPTGFPGAGTTERNAIGAGTGFFYSPSLPVATGDPPVTPTFTHYDSNGRQVSGGSPGNTLDLAFPPGYVPKKVDLRDEPQDVADHTNLDPCFAHAASDNNMLPPGVGPGDGTNEPPPGVSPGNELPALPGTPGSPGGGLPPGMTPIGPGNEVPGIPGNPGGGGSGGDGGGGGSGGGGVVILPDVPAPDGEAPADPGLGLPGDKAGEGNADRIGKKFSDAIGKIQTELAKFTSTGTISPDRFGQSSTWTISLPLGNNQVHTMTIPTVSASLVRALLLVLVTGIFIVSMYNLLLGK